ncbi:hypothetical protein HDU82_004170, partial [Entophlyctis luteolus]
MVFHQAGPLADRRKIGKKQKPSQRGQSSTQQKGELARLKNQISTLALQVKQLKSEPGTGKIQLIKAGKAGDKFVYHLKNVPVEKFQAKHPIYLDCGASRHVVPVEIQLQNVVQVPAPLALTDATNNITPIQFEGDFSHNIGGKVVNFSKAVVVDKASDVLISASQWLAGTDDRIILTEGSAFFQAANSNTGHEIAKVVNGMYCMNPIASLPASAKAAWVDLIASNKGTREARMKVFSIPRRYSKIMAVFDANDLEDSDNEVNQME